jgi:two-component system OmpR family sensor kinase
MKGGLRRDGRTRLRTRVLAGVLAITVISFVAFDIGAIVQLRHYLVGRTDTALQTAVAVSKPHIGRFVTQARMGIPTPLIEDAAGFGGYSYVAFIPTNGSPVVLDASGPTPHLPSNLKAIAASGSARTVTSRHGDQQLRLVAAEVDGGTLVVTAGLEDVDRTVGNLALIVIVGSIAAILLIALGVIVVVTRGLSPIESVADQADLISAGDLSHRVEVPNAASEVDRLATALNEMLARIASFVEKQRASEETTRRFLGDASHELRTPLASLRANAELYQQGALAEPEQIDEAMRRITLESKRMSRLVDDMMQLVRLDQHPSPVHELVDLSSVVTASVERAQLADPGRRWCTAVHPDLVVLGDGELVGRIVDNLVTNILTHTPVSTQARVTASHIGESLVVEVSDDGPGVAIELLPHIFKRFYRVGGRSHTRGSGLGLAIVADIVATHNGTIEATVNEPRGLLMRLTLPSADDQLHP